MKNKLIPIYREKEIYTLFYDKDHNKLYKFPHRDKSSFVYVLLFILVLYGSRIVNAIYQPYKGLLLNITLFFIVNIICYIIARYFFNHYYIPKTERTIFYNQESMESFAYKGEKQFRLELNLGGGLSLLLAGGGYTLFFMFSQIELLIIGCLGSVPLFMIIINKPFTRIKILREFQNKEIEL
ncbi:hypothetical protein JNUCC74_07280 [Cerasibacillus sp. JNUCC 74]